MSPSTVRRFPCCDSYRQQHGPPKWLEESQLGQDIDLVVESSGFRCQKRRSAFPRPVHFLREDDAETINAPLVVRVILEYLPAFFFILGPALLERMIDTALNVVGLHPFGDLVQSPFLAVLEVERSGAEGRGNHFTGLRVNSLMVRPLTGSLRVKRSTFFPLVNEISTGLVWSHLPMV